MPPSEPSIDREKEQLRNAARALMARAEAAEADVVRLTRERDEARELEAEARAHLRAALLAEGDDWTWTTPAAAFLSGTARPAEEVVK